MKLSFVDHCGAAPHRSQRSSPSVLGIRLRYLVARIAQRFTQDDSIKKFTPNSRQWGRHRHAFTLFEVSISLVVVVFGVVTVLMLIPQGLKAQQNARMQVHACVVMQNLARQLVEPGRLHYGLQVESRLPTNNQFMRRGLDDLETIAEGASLGLAPMPTAIARRLDSDNDEISRIVAEGGNIYYNLPGNAPQTLIMGFIGSPQVNALPNHPCLSWPYWDNHPMAPAKWERDQWLINSNIANNLPSRVWTNFREFDELYQVFNTENNPGHASNPNPAISGFSQWAQYLEKAKALVLALNIPLEVVGYPGHPIGKGPIPRHPLPLPSGDWTGLPQDELDPRPEYVWAISHLAHAAGMATATLSGTIPAGFPTPDDRAYAQATYEACVAWVRRMTVMNPYNWGVARHLSTMTAWDFPLLQYDMFPTSSFPTFNDPVLGDRGYRIVSPIPVTHHGQARGIYGNYASGALVQIPANYPYIRNNWGNPDHFQLTRRFDPNERMRQVVFWAVDWQSYEDFESQPAPPHDASMGFRDSNGVHVCADWWGITMPERSLYWTNNTRSNAAGNRFNHAPSGSNQTFDSWTDSQEYKAGYFMGIYGADRNGNSTFNRGPVPASARLRALPIARFTIYDRTLIGDGRF